VGGEVRTAPGVDVRPQVEPAEARLPAAGRPGIDERRADTRHVASEPDARAPVPIASRIPGQADARAPLRVPDDGRATLIFRAVEIEAGAEVEREAAAVAPRVVEVRRVRADVVADALLEDRQPVDERGVVVPELRVNRRAVDDRRRRGDVVLAAGLPVVVLPPLLEVVEAGDEIVRAQFLRGQEVARFSEPVPVVAMLEPSPAAYRAEGGGFDTRFAVTTGLWAFQ